MNPPEMPCVAAVFVPWYQVQPNWWVEPWLRAAELPLLRQARCPPSYSMEMANFYNWNTVLGIVCCGTANSWVLLLQPEVDIFRCSPTAHGQHSPGEQAPVALNGC